MKYYLIALVVIVVLAVGGFYLYSGSTHTEPQVSSVSAKAWAEIVSPSMSNLSQENVKIKDLQTGDEVSAGSKVEAGPVGLGNIYLPDGSVARVEAGAKLNIDDSQYDEKSQKVTTRLALSAGRVWVKVFGLVTPDSVWEVKTSNVVATVRGTAFGVEYKKGQTLILGSQGKVSVAVIDPKTKLIIGSSTVFVTADTAVIIKDSDISNIADGRSSIVVKPIPPELKNDEWVKRSVLADQKFDAMKADLQKKGVENEDIRESFIKEIKKQTPPTPDNLLPAKAGVSEKPLTGTVPAGVQSAGRVGGSGLAAPVDFMVGTKAILFDVIEGDMIPFDAILVLSDGTKRVINPAVKWQVSGQIGTISRFGVFSAQLDPLIAEQGQSEGAVSATWVDPDSGKKFSADGPTFIVNAKFDSAPATTTGQ